MNLKQKAAKIVNILKESYPASCSLDANKDYELLFSTRLAAQCTDARVNLVTPVLFSRFPTLPDLASAELSELEEIVHPCGFYKTKAKDIKAAANMLVDRYGLKVPDTMEELLKLPGVGRKTANIILGDIYKKPAVVTDTHCIRISNRLGLCDTEDPYKVELALAEIVEPSEQSDFCHRLVHFGRDVCTARSPKCFKCPLNELCPRKNIDRKHRSRA
jgi:endonuclease-3